MKQRTKQASAPARPAPSEDEIRDYAFHLYQQSGCVPGHDLDNWLEAKACLESNIPKQHTHVRLHRHRHHPAPDAIALVAIAVGEMLPEDDDVGAEAVVVEEVFLR